MSGEPNESQANFRFRLSSLMFWTTVAAIAFAGLARTGSMGAIVCLYASWLGVLGVICFQRAWHGRHLRRMGYSTLGIACLLTALAMFILVVVPRIEAF